MMTNAHPLYRIIFLLVLAPIGAAVTIAALLLFGVEPHAVFFVGFAVRSALNKMGLPSPKSAGVLSTVFVWWVIIVIAGLAWERHRRQSRA
ncbi:MAG: hypothetical protein ABIP63_09595 [Thermoanaerobaculia bacterium]